MGCNLSSSPLPWWLTKDGDNFDFFQDGENQTDYTVFPFKKITTVHVVSGIKPYIQLILVWQMGSDLSSSPSPWLPMGDGGW